MYVLCNSRIGGFERRERTLTFTGFSVIDGFFHVSEEALFAVVAVSAVGEMSTLNAHPSAYSARQFEELHVEPALTGVLVALARCIIKHIN